MNDSNNCAQNKNAAFVKSTLKQNKYVSGLLNFFEKGTIYLTFHMAHGWLGVVGLFPYRGTTGDRQIDRHMTENIIFTTPLAGSNYIHLLIISKSVIP